MMRQMLDNFSNTYCCIVRSLPIKARNMKRNDEKPEIFISYASEDRTEVAVPLADALRARGLRVWIDDTSLQLDDSLLEHIDRALAKCEYGVVILSPSYFQKVWTQRELSALAAREASANRKVILPVWHGLSASDLARLSPSLAGRLSVNTEQGVDRIVARILDAIGESEPRRSSVTQLGVDEQDPFTDPDNNAPPWAALLTYWRERGCPSCGAQIEWMNEADGGTILRWVWIRHH